MVIYKGDGTVSRSTLAILCIFASIGISVAQTSLPGKSKASLTEDTAATLREQNDAFLTTASDASVALKKRLVRQEQRLTDLLQQLSDAEKKKD